MPRDEFGRKYCTSCKKPEGEVFFSPEKAECKKCRAAKEIIQSSTPERALFIKHRNMQKLNAEKSKIYLTGVDPCDKCAITTCKFCVVLAAKRNFLLQPSPALNEFIFEYSKNLLAILKDSM